MRHILDDSYALAKFNEFPVTKLGIPIVWGCKCIEKVFKRFGIFPQNLHDTAEFKVILDQFMKLHWLDIVVDHWFEHNLVILFPLVEHTLVESKIFPLVFSLLIVNEKGYFFDSWLWKEGSWGFWYQTVADFHNVLVLPWPDKESSDH